MRWAGRFSVAVGAVATAAIVFVAALSLPHPSTSPAAAGPTSNPTETPLAAEATSTASSKPAAGSPSPDPLGACGVYVDQVDRMPEFYTVASVTKFSQAVVVGEVVAIGEAQWATKNGTVPVDEFGVHPSAADVYRVVDIQVDGIGKRSDQRPVSVDEVIHIRVLGGSIGCREYAFSDDEDFLVSDEVVVFLGSQPTLVAAPSRDFDAVTVWRVQDGRVQSRDGLLSVDAVLQMSTQPPN
jgi:hypothetical protein